MSTHWINKHTFLPDTDDPAHCKCGARRDHPEHDSERGLTELEIVRLRLKASYDENAALLAQNARLRAALSELADVGNLLDGFESAYLAARDRKETK